MWDNAANVFWQGQATHTMHLTMHENPARICSRMPDLSRMHFRAVDNFCDLFLETQCECTSLFFISLHCGGMACISFWFWTTIWFWHLGCIFRHLTQDYIRCFAVGIFLCSSRDGISVWNAQLFTIYHRGDTGVVGKGMGCWRFIFLSIFFNKL